MARPDSNRGHHDFSRAAVASESGRFAGNSAGSRRVRRVQVSRTLRPPSRRLGPTAGPVGFSSPGPATPEAAAAFRAAAECRGDYGRVGDGVGDPVAQRSGCVASSTVEDAERERFRGHRPFTRSNPQAGRNSSACGGWWARFPSEFAAAGCWELADDEVVGVLDHVLDHLLGEGPVDDHCVPAALVEVVAGERRRVRVAQCLGERRVAF
jgi:hypothetical protein